MVTITIGSNNYESYQDVAAASAYLAADIARSAKWAALTTDAKGQALVTATRWIATLSFPAGLPPYSGAPSAVVEATTLLAADLAANPKLALTRQGSTGQNIKRVRAGSVETEFFREDTAGPLPRAALDVLIAAGLIDLGGDVATPFYSGGDTESRFTYDAAAEDDCL